jgi:hypothetical protein
VTPGSAGWLINIGFGEVIIGGSWIKEDLDQLDAIDLGHPVGNDRHYTVYATYTYTDTDPPATAVYASTAGATPPTIPTIPAGAVKLADIFVPTAATSILHASVRIVNAPKAHGPSKVIDTAEIPERLVMSNKNTVMFTDGTFSFDGPTQELRWTQDVIYQAPVSYNREVYEDVSLVRATLPAGSSPLVIPGGVGSEDAIVYAIIDRSVPNLAAPLALKVVDLTAVSPTELDDFYDPLNQTKIITIAVVKNGKLHMGGSIGTIPDLVGAPEGKVLAESPVGASGWQSLKDEWMVGGHRVVVWDEIMYPDAPTALLSLVPASLRKVGMTVRAIGDGSATEVEYVWGGVNFALYQPDQPSLASQYGYGVIGNLETNCVVDSPTGTLDITISPGSFVDGRGRQIGLLAEETVTIPDSTLPRVIYWRASTQSFTHAAMSSGISLLDDMPFAIAIGDGAGDLSKLVDIRRAGAGPADRLDRLTVGPATVDAGWRWPYKALLWLCCFDDNDAVIPSIIEMFSTTTHVASESFPGSIDANTGSAVVTGNGTRFLARFQVGDHLYSDGVYMGEVAGPITDTSMTLTGNANFNKVAATHQRGTYAGPSSYMFDFAAPEWTSAAAVRLSNVTIRGTQPGAPTPRPAISWGGFNLNCDPLFDFAAAGSPNYFAVEGIRFVYGGDGNLARSEHTVFKDVPEGFSTRNVHFDNGELTHLYRWVTSTNLGGVADGDDTNGVTLEGITADNPLLGGDTPAFKFDSDVTGKLSIDGLLFVQDNNPVDYLFDFGNVDRSAATVAILAERAQIGDVTTALFRHLDGVGGANVPFSTAPKRIRSGSKLKSLGGTCKLGSGTSGLAVDMAGVELASTMDLAGGHVLTECWSQAAATINLVAGIGLYACDFPTTVGDDLPDVNLNQADSIKRILNQLKLGEGLFSSDVLRALPALTTGVGARSNVGGEDRYVLLWSVPDPGNVGDIRFYYRHPPLVGFGNGGLVITQNCFYREGTLDWATDSGSVGVGFFFGGSPISADAFQVLSNPGLGGTWLNSAWRPNLGLQVGNNIIQSLLTIDDDVTLGDKLTVTGDAEVDGDVFVDGDLNSNNAQIEFAKPLDMGPLPISAGRKVFIKEDAVLGQSMYQEFINMVALAADGATGTLLYNFSFADVGNASGIIHVVLDLAGTAWESNTRSLSYSIQERVSFHFKTSPNSEMVFSAAVDSEQGRESGTAPAFFSETVILPTTAFSIGITGDGFIKLAGLVNGGVRLDTRWVGKATICIAQD